MKRLLYGLGGILALVSCVLGGLSQTANAQDANDFVIESFSAEYRLGRDTEGRSTLKTTERITATFPDFDQNHGLERALPDTYDGHTARLQVDSVTDESGNELAYETQSSNDNTVLRIGDADTYAYGVKTYIITYIQHDVTRFFQDTNADEFYWDVNGTGWGQTIKSVDARVIIDLSLQSSLNGNIYCYQGASGQSEPCTKGGSGTKGLVFASSRVLQPGENITMAIGFKPHTFNEYQQSQQEKVFAVIATVWVVLLIISSIGAIIAIIVMTVHRSKIMGRSGGGQTIPVEYLPPKNMSVLGSAQMTKLATTAVTAQLLDLAVRHFIKIYQTKEKKLLQSAEYELEITKSLDQLRSEEKRLLVDLFGKNPAIGDRFAMKKLRSNYSITSRLTKSVSWLRDLLRSDYGMFEKADKEAKRYNTVAVWLLVIGIITFSPLVIVAAIVGFWNAATLWPETKKGADMHDYIDGLKQYISLAEADRIKLLQSPEGADKVGNIADDKGQLITLYERVLGYAVLFGVEKEWMKQLGAYYEDSATQPDWYVGNAAFNAVVFSSAISSFSEQSTSYSSPTSSSSGGSGGGGFSGGGGGGGGGGGW